MCRLISARFTVGSTHMPTVVTPVYRYNARRDISDRHKRLCREGCPPPTHCTASTDLRLHAMNLSGGGVPTPPEPSNRAAHRATIPAETSPRAPRSSPASRMGASFGMSTSQLSSVAGSSIHGRPHVARGAVAPSRSGAHEPRAGRPAPRGARLRWNSGET